jgi:hypothetical protein
MKNYRRSSPGSPPSPAQLETSSEDYDQAMRDWFLDTKSVKPTPQLWGSSMARFDDENDLVALRVPADQDRLRN